MKPRIVKRVTGTNFESARARLVDYKSSMGGTVYSYIRPEEGSYVDGLVLYNVDDVSLAKIDRYEAVGELYNRREIDVIVKRRKLRAQTYVANIVGLRRLFGDAIEFDARMEEYLEEKLEVLLDEESASEMSDIDRRAKCELLGVTLEELAEAHFIHPADLSYRIQQLWSDTTPPNWDRVLEKPKAKLYANAYIELAVRHMIFNQLERKVRHYFPEAIQMPSHYFVHTLSDLVAMTYMNQKHSVIQQMISQMKADEFDLSRDYLDYASASVRIADALYSYEEFAEIIEWVEQHRQEGHLPLGIEVEFSNLGTAAPHAAEGQDPIYDSFYYFHDFDLLERCWKLGGHVDDHRLSYDTSGNSRGFLEYAFGRTRMSGKLSRPTSNDPWVLSQLINQASVFSRLLPHSLHITMQVEILDFKRVTPPEYLYCLLLLGGDIHPDEKGNLREWRLYNRELKDDYTHLHFTEENMRTAAYNDDPDSGSTSDVCNWVVEYKFPRLRRRFNYEPFIVASKGFQLGFRPRPLSSQIRILDDYATEETDAILQWAADPHPISLTAIRDFVEWVEIGLLQENSGRPAHSPAYIYRCLDEIEIHLIKLNQELTEYRKHAQ